MNAFARWFGRIEHDGAAAALEAVATRLPESVLEPAPAVQDRRRRAFEPTRQAMLEAVGKQVLHGWLQNRHQTLLPMTVNFRILGEREARLLAETMAAGVLASSAAGGAEHDTAVSFLRAAGASEATIDVFTAALATPQPLRRLFDSVKQSHGLGPLAYILLVVVNDMRDPANAIFLQWAAARLDLPTTVVRSVERRYRT